MKQEEENPTRNSIQPQPQISSSLLLEKIQKWSKRAPRKRAPKTAYAPLSFGAGTTTSTTTPPSRGLYYAVAGISLSPAGQVGHRGIHMPSEPGNGNLPFNPSLLNFKKKKSLPSQPLSLDATCTPRYCSNRAQPVTSLSPAHRLPRKVSPLLPWPSPPGAFLGRTRPCLSDTGAVPRPGPAAPRDAASTLPSGRNGQGSLALTWVYGTRTGCDARPIPSRFRTTT